MIRVRSLLFIGSAALASNLVAQSISHKDLPPPSSASATLISDMKLDARIESYVQRVLWYQGIEHVRVKSMSRPDSSGLRLVVVSISTRGKTADLHYYVTADGRDIVDGSVAGLNVNIWDKNRKTLELDGFPSSGLATDAPTLVVFSDFACKYCKLEDAVLAHLRSEAPSTVRIIFKYLPLTMAHGWP